MYSSGLRISEVVKIKLTDLNINEIESLQGGPSSDGNVRFHTPDCPWRENMVSPIRQYLDREEESHEAKLKRNKIPPKKINDMIARWILTLVSIHTHHKNTNESLAHVVYKERVKALSAFNTEVKNSNFPYQKTNISMHPGEKEKFLESIEKWTPIHQ